MGYLPPVSGQSIVFRKRREFCHSMTTEKVVAALDKPRSIYSVLGIVNPGGDVDVVQTLLMQMREEGLVKFDIKKGLWSRATPPAA